MFREKRSVARRGGEVSPACRVPGVALDYPYPKFWKDLLLVQNYILAQKVHRNGNTPSYRLDGVLCR